HGVMPMNHSGVSLVELLLAIFLTTAAVMTISMTFPQVSKGILSDRQRWIAAGLANSRIETIRSQPSSLIDATEAGEFVGTTASCNCQVDDFTLIPSTQSQLAGTTMTMATCVNYVSRGGSTWNPQCPPNDTGYKSILVRVWWDQGGQHYSVSQESL